MEFRSVTPSTTVFLFAHQDDEMGVFHEIEKTCSEGGRVHVIYLTNGAWGGATPETRNAESLRVLKQLGVDNTNVHFLGGELGIGDGTLPDNIGRVAVALAERLVALAPIARFITLAWEGGHQDHDAVHWLSVRAAGQHGVLDASRQFSLYRAAGTRFLPYVVMQPLPENGKVERSGIGWRRRLAYLRLCLNYASQRKTMLGLLPFMALDFAISGEQKLSRLSWDRLRQRPHSGALLYEKRRRYRFEDFCKAMAAAESYLSVDFGKQDRHMQS